MKHILISATVALSLLVGIPHAQATLFDFTTGTPDLSNFGNSLTQTVDGIEVVVTGWSAQSEDFTPSQVRVFSTGLGTCASSEGTNCPGGPRTVDNKRAGRGGSPHLRCARAAR